MCSPPRLLRARVVRDRPLRTGSCALAWPDSVLFYFFASQVSEVEMRGMLALEMELSVEEILVYRDVARCVKWLHTLRGRRMSRVLTC